MLANLNLTDGNAAPIVADAQAAIDVNGHVNMLAKTRQIFIHRIVNQFIDEVMKTANARIGNVIIGPFPNMCSISRNTCVFFSEYSSALFNTGSMTAVVIRAHSCIHLPNSFKPSLKFRNGA